MSEMSRTPSSVDADSGTIRARRRNWPGVALTYLYVFRIVVVGSCLVIVGVGWLAHIAWLVIAGACIGAGEFIESTYYIVVLTWGQHTGRIKLILTLFWTEPAHERAPQVGACANLARRS
jgi:hypothetical protein